MSHGRRAGTVGCGRTVDSMPAMPEAEPIPTFAPGGAPISLLVDYDGTISRLDVGDTLLERLAVDQAEVARKDAQYDAGEVGSRELLRWDMDVLPQDRELLLAIATTVPQDETLGLLVECARADGAAVEIVSDGLGFYIPDNLARLGLADLPVATNHTTVSGGGAGMRFPYGNPRCFVCGTCKRERVFLHQAAGRIVVFIGDGTSDRYAAAHADVVFAKGKLIDICRAEGWAAHDLGLLRGHRRVARGWPRRRDAAADDRRGGRLAGRPAGAAATIHLWTGGVGRGPHHATPSRTCRGRVG